MAYPESVDRFIEKLNKADTVYVIQDEELILENGVFEGELAHDNVKNESVMVFTGPNMTGERIQNFFLSIPSNAPWKRIIKVFANAPKVYVTYETTGDQVEAEDINRLQDSIVATQKELEKIKLIQVSTYTHNQIVPLSMWTITHNLKKYPCVTVVDSSGSVVVGDVKYLSENELQVSFSGAFAGKAYLN